MDQACIVCKADTATVLRRGCKILNSNSKDVFSQKVFEKYGTPALGLTAICNCCLKKLENEREYRLLTVFI
jgi:hypothetical protein